MIVELNTYIHVGLLFIKPKQYFLNQLLATGLGCFHNFDGWNLLLE